MMGLQEHQSCDLYTNILYMFKRYINSNFDRYLKVVIHILVPEYYILCNYTKIHTYMSELL